MVAPKKRIMGRGESAVSVGRSRSIASKPVVKVKPKTKTKVAEPKSNVKVKQDPFANINSKPKAPRNKPTGSNVKVIKNPFAGL